MSTPIAVPEIFQVSPSFVGLGLTLAGAALVTKRDAVDIAEADGLHRWIRPRGPPPRFTVAVSPIAMFMLPPIALHQPCQ